MGLFEVKASTARWVHGRLIYTPLPPEPRWKGIAYGSVPVLIAALYLVANGSAPGYIAAMLIVCAGLAGFAWFRRGRKPIRPTDPLEVTDPLLARVRRLLETGRVGDAMLAVETELAVTLTDAKLIVDAVQRRIDHERAEAREGR